MQGWRACCGVHRGTRGGTPHQVAAPQASYPDHIGGDTRHICATRHFVRVMPLGTTTHAYNYAVCVKPWRHDGATREAPAEDRAGPRGEEEALPSGAECVHAPKLPHPELESV